jgi:hypothetical protein
MLVTVAYTGLRWGEIIGLEREYLHPGEIHVEWQLRELGGRFYRLPPRTTRIGPRVGTMRSRRPCPRSSTPCLPARRPTTPTTPARASPCTAAAAAISSAVLTAPTTGAAITAAASAVPPATAASTPAAPGLARLVIADATTWPGTPLTFHPPVQPGATTGRHGGEASSAFPRTLRPRAGCPSSPV